MDIELVRGASHTFNREAYPRRQAVPGVLRLGPSTTSACRACSTPSSICPGPPPVKTRMVNPSRTKFSGFVFRSRPTWDPKHPRPHRLHPRLRRPLLSAAASQAGEHRQEPAAINNAITFMA